MGMRHCFLEESGASFDCVSDTDRCDQGKRGLCLVSQMESLDKKHHVSLMCNLQGLQEGKKPQTWQSAKKSPNLEVSSSPEELGLGLFIKEGSNIWIL